MPIVMLLLLIVAIVFITWLTANLIGLLLTLLIAGLVGALADAIVPGHLPFGWLGAILAGLIGSWIGTAIMGHVGPAIFGIQVIPAIVGAIILAFVASLLFKQTASGQRLPGRRNRF